MEVICEGGPAANVDPLPKCVSPQNPSIQRRRKLSADKIIALLWQNRKVFKELMWVNGLAINGYVVVKSLGDEDIVDVRLRFDYSVFPLCRPLFGL